MECVTQAASSMEMLKIDMLNCNVEHENVGAFNMTKDDDFALFVH